jgi:hypothetical protein
MELPVERTEPISVWTMFCLFIDKDFGEIGVSQGGVLFVAYNQGGNIGFGKRLPQRPDRGSATENITDIIISDNQNAMNAVLIK